MTLKIYNTLTRRKEPFEPLESGKVRMYVCGPTVYDSCHIGHARSVAVFDVIYRYLVARGYEVFYVRNFTDVDDKIINRANALGISSEAVAQKYIDEFHQDMAALNMVAPSIEPRATAHIDPIIDLVTRLIDRGHAYAVDGDVFFAVESFREYGKLSGRRLEDMVAGSRVEIDRRKRNPYDFALWKASKPSEPAWDSPWGKGRPGWHIECSAMSAKYLGETFDIHGGGQDLIFPHHENEIAQSEAAFGKPFVRYWIHNGFININQEKMSKSLGNFLTIREIVAKYPPEALRLFLLSNHYRSPLDFTDQAMTDAASGLDKIYTLLARVEQYLGEPPAKVFSNPATDESGETVRLFREAMDDDFNTAKAIGIFFDSIRKINRFLDADEATGRNGNRNAVIAESTAVIGIGKILGIACQSPHDYFSRKTKAVESQGIDPAWIEEMIVQRTAARKARDFAAADRIRKELESKNILLEDRPDGTIWKLKP